MKSARTERIAVAYVIVATIAMIAAHPTNVLLGRTSTFLAWPGAGTLALVLCGALLVSAVAVRRSTQAAVVTGASMSLGATAAVSAIIGAVTVPVVLIVATVAGGLALARIAARLPHSLDGVLRRQRVATIAWAILGLATVVQTGRLSTYMADPTYDWVLTTKNEFWSRHMCMQAYFYAADLNRQGDPNVYLADHYPGLNPDAIDRATVANLTPDDPYQYPPQFLLLPRLAIAMSNDFFVIRTVWFALQALGFLLVMFLFARWYGGPGGRIALWLIPLVWISVPSMLNFQYGQFHVSTIALAVGALMAFDRRRAVLGGSLLACAILSKGFPGVLLLPLFFQRRWKDLGSTVAWSAGLTVAAWAVVGWEPFASFFAYHLPRVRGGEAFAFHEVWPEFAAPLLAGNVSPYSLVLKLNQLGWTGASEWMARGVQGVFSIGVLALGAISARVHTREERALAWLALINIAAMTSPAAWGDYVPAGVLWMATFLFASTGRHAFAVSFVAVAAGMSFLLPGVVPIGNFPAAVPSMLISIAYTVLLVAFNGWVAIRGARLSTHAFRTAPATVRPALRVAWRRESR